jgi:hypothetical protein
MQTEMILPGLETIVQPFKFPATPHEYKVTALRECPTPDALQLCETRTKPPIIGGCTLPPIRTSTGL